MFYYCEMHIGTQSVFQEFLIPALHTKSINCAWYLNAEQSNCERIFYTQANTKQVRSTGYLYPTHYTFNLGFLPDKDKIALQRSGETRFSLPLLSY